MKSGTMVVSGSATVVIPLEHCPGPHTVKFVRWWKKKARLHCGSESSCDDKLEAKVVRHPAPGIAWGLEITWTVYSARKIFWFVADIHSDSF